MNNNSSSSSSDTAPLARKHKKFSPYVKSRNSQLDGSSPFAPTHIFGCRALFVCWWIFVPLLLYFIITLVYDPVGSFRQELFPSQTILLPPTEGRTLRYVTLPWKDLDLPPNDKLTLYQFQVAPPLLQDTLFTATHHYDISLISTHDNFYCQDFFLNKNSTITVEWKTDNPVEGDIEISNSVPCEFLASYDEDTIKNSPPVQVYDATSKLPTTSTSWKGSYQELSDSKLISVILTKPKDSPPISGSLTVVANLTVYDVNSATPAGNLISQCTPSAKKDCGVELSTNSDDSSPPPAIIQLMGNNVGSSITDFTTVRFDVLFFQKDSIVGNFLVGLFIFIPVWFCSGMAIFCYNPLGRYSWYVPYSNIKSRCSGSDNGSPRSGMSSTSRDLNDTETSFGNDEDYGSISHPPTHESGITLGSL